jgi:hypothetical protein
MTRLANFFGGHPGRQLAGGVVALVVVSLAWYLGSPLFITTYTDEALPTIRPAATDGVSSLTAAVATVSPTPLGSDSGRTRILATGELGYVDALHNGKGPVRLVELTPGSERFVRFEDVAVTNAPDIHVYLSRETGGKWSESTSLYLGPLKATNGSFNYAIPAETDLAPYRSVVVWCRAFRVLITWADLKAA